MNISTKEILSSLRAKNGRITIFGAGKSGLAVANKLRGYNLFMTEAKRKLDNKTRKFLLSRNIPIELGGHTLSSLANSGLVIVSPGVDINLPILKKAQKKGVPVISEIELAYAFLKKPIIAVTGTNGKTTTTTLIGKILKDAGFKVAVAGNIGSPLITVNDKNLDYVVAEISSYQLESIRQFRPWVSIILNITPDHLTRHRTMHRYAMQKAAIFRNQIKNDHLIFNGDDRSVKTIIRSAKCDKIAFGRNWIRRGDMFAMNKKICRVEDIAIKGAHNTENAMASAAAAILCGVKPGSIRDTLERFKGVEHRIEYVRNVRGVTFYNDSKATNPDSTIVAIKAVKPRHGIVLILGGRDKMTGLMKMCKDIKKSVKEVVLIGEAKNRFKKGLLRCGFKKLREASSFKDAIKLSYRIAHKGDAVLLSPACASFDMFNNYEERGKEFKKIVAGL